MDSKYLANDIFIPHEELNGAKDGDKVVVEIVEWPRRPTTRWEGGGLLQPGQNDTEMHATRQYGLPYSYPKQVESTRLK